MTKHDVIAFLTHLAEFIGADARFVHQGMTSSDVLDTCLSVQLARAADPPDRRRRRSARGAEKARLRAQIHATIGRSHGMHAEPTTFGLKLAQAYAEFTRARARLVTARAEIAICAISGAVGTFAKVDPRVEAHVAKSWDFCRTRIDPGHSARPARRFFCDARRRRVEIERLATEIRHLQRTEVLEAEEYLLGGAEGSSAMPHKRNPVLSENLAGLARMVRWHVMPALEDVALWHERDISHSSVERMIGPDATVTLDFALVRLTGVIDKLVVYPDVMRKNLDQLGGLVNSQRVLIALTQKGVSREDAYAIVQRNALAQWRGEGDFRKLIGADPAVASKLTSEELDQLFDLSYHCKHVDTIFSRVFSS